MYFFFAPFFLLQRGPEWMMHEESLEKIVAGQVFPSKEQSSKSGWLLKRGEKGVKLWKKRWVCVWGSAVAYYVDENTVVERPKGGFLMGTSEVVVEGGTLLVSTRCAMRSKGGKGGLIESRGRVFAFRSVNGDEKELLEWRMVLMACMGGSPPRGVQQSLDDAWTPLDVCMLAHLVGANGAAVEPDKKDGVVVIRDAEVPAGYVVLHLLPLEARRLVCLSPTEVDRELEERFQRVERKKSPDQSFGEWASNTVAFVEVLHRRGATVGALRVVEDLLAAPSDELSKWPDILCKATLVGARLYSALGPSEENVDRAVSCFERAIPLLSGAARRQVRMEQALQCLRLECEEEYVRRGAKMLLLAVKNSGGGGGGGGVDAIQEDIVSRIIEAAKRLHLNDVVKSLSPENT